MPRSSFTLAPLRLPTLSHIGFALLGCVLLVGCGKSASTAESQGDAKQDAGGEVERAPAPEPLTQEQLEELYRASKARWEATENLPDESFAELKADLSRVANEAEDPHLRANASLLLGGLHEARDDQRAAISYYRQALELIPDEVEPHIVLALALAKAERWDDAIAEQWIVVQRIPDDLVGWLLLGELQVKGGHDDEAAKVYGAYELRRKGLLDGLTLKQGGEYVEDVEERVACAEALAPAVDIGTARALMYALDSDPSPEVRATIVAVMGEQRLAGFEKILTSKAGTETNEDVKEAIAWALAEIQRDPIDTKEGPIPEDLAKQVEAEAEAQEADAANAPQPPAGAASGDTGGGETGGDETGGGETAGAADEG